MKRIRVRNISWKDYGISVQTQRELKEFCFLYDEKKKHKAVVRSDGTVKFGGETGSIHQMGAAAQDSTTCNGWAYWHYVDPKKHKLVCIDELRQIVRAEMFGE